MTARPDGGPGPAAGGREEAGGDLPDLGEIELVDHHCHSVLTTDLTLGEFELLSTEASDPPPMGTTFFDSQLGLSLRRWCPSVLGLTAHCEPAAYLDRRRELGAAEVSRRFLAAAGVTEILVDTGYRPDELAGPAELGTAAGARAYPVVRLEQLAEEVAARGTGGAEFADHYRAALAAAASGAPAVKSIVAYRHGLDFDPARPGDGEVRSAAERWLNGRGTRLTSPVLLRFLLWSAVDLGLPIQIHTGFGDSDLDLHRCNPLLLTGFIRATAPVRVPLMLLHCYPYHREAGYLAQIYPHVYCDVGLALNFTGARAHVILAEAMELAPFAKSLYSSDAFGLPELHYLGALSFRRAIGRVLGDWLRDGMLTVADAGRIARMIGAGNARRVYRL